MLRFRPALAATLRPGAWTVPDAERVMLVIAKSSTAITSQVSMSFRAVWWWKSRRWLASVRCSLASLRLARRRLPDPGRQRVTPRCAAASSLTIAARNRGLATTSPSEVAANRATPTSKPISRPVAGCGTGCCSVTTMTYQRRASRLSRSVFTRPTTGRWALTLTCRHPGSEPLPTCPPGRASGHRHHPQVDRGPASRGLEARVAGPAAGRHSMEETLEGAVQTAQGLLLTGERPATLSVRVGPADLGELRGLVAVADRHPVAPCLPALFQGGVVQVAVGVQQGSGALLLPPGGVGTELVGATHDVIVAARCDGPK